MARMASKVPDTHWVSCRRFAAAKAYQNISAEILGSWREKSKTRTTRHVLTACSYSSCSRTSSERFRATANAVTLHNILHNLGSIVQTTCYLQATSLSSSNRTHRPKTETLPTQPNPSRVQVGLVTQHRDLHGYLRKTLHALTWVPESLRGRTGPRRILSLPTRFQRAAGSRHRRTRYRRRLLPRVPLHFRLSCSKQP